MAKKKKETEKQKNEREEKESRDRLIAAYKELSPFDIDNEYRVEELVPSVLKAFVAASKVNARGAFGANISMIVASAINLRLVGISPEEDGDMVPISANGEKIYAYAHACTILNNFSSVTCLMDELYSFGDSEANDVLEIFGDKMKAMQ